MRTRRASGKDGFTVAAVRYGGPKLRRRIYTIVREMWNKASESEDGSEAQEWPDEWKIGLVVPL